MNIAPAQRHKTPKLSTRKNIPNEARVRVSHETPKKRVIVAHDIAENAYSLFLNNKDQKYTSLKTCS